MPSSKMAMYCAASCSAVSGPEVGTADMTEVTFGRRLPFRQGIFLLAGNGAGVDAVHHYREVLRRDLLNRQPALRTVPSRGHPYHIPYEPVDQLHIEATAELAGPDAAP